VKEGAETEEWNVGFWHRAKVMLGLADDFDEEYDDYDQHGETDQDEAYAPSRRTETRAPYDGGYADAPTIHHVRREPDVPRAREAVPLRAVTSRPEHADGAAGAQVQMHIAEPRSYGEAQTIADRVKAGTPVIMNLTGTDPDLSKRFIDFASGLTYGLDGGLQKVSDRVFMLTPANVSVSAEDRRRLRDKGLFSLDG
jgi:cell division inhibitor SepF